MASETFSDDFGESAGKASYEKFFEYENMQVSYEIFDGETHFMATKETHEGSGYISYAFADSFIAGAEIDIVTIDAFLPDAVDGIVSVFARVNGEDEYRKVNGVRSEKTVVKENGDYTCYSSKVSCTDFPENTVQIRVVLDPNAYGYINYTLRIDGISLTLADAEGNGWTDMPVKEYDPDAEIEVRHKEYTEHRNIAFTSADGTTIRYTAVYPEDYDPDREYPLLMYLHGLGGDTGTTYFLEFIKKIYTSGHECIVIAPFAVLADGEYWIDSRALYEEHTESGAVCSYTQSKYTITPVLQAAKELSEYFQSSHKIGNRLISGFSMGGYGTWDLITRYPYAFDAAAPLSGGGDPATVGKIADMPIYAVHGNADVTVDVMGTKRMVDALKEAGSTDIQYLEVEGGDHGIVYVAYDAIMEWLFGEFEKRVEPISEESEAESIPAESQNESQSSPESKKPLQPAVIALIVAAGAAVAALGFVAIKKAGKKTADSDKTRKHAK